LGPDGNLSGAIINRDAYEFFLKKVEEEEDRLDNQTVERFLQIRGERSMKDDLMEDMKDIQEGVID